MAKVEIKRNFPGKESGECFQANLQMAQKAGYQIVKVREIASLIISQGKVDGHPVDLTLIVPFGFPTAVVMTLSSEAAEDHILEMEANRLFMLLEVEL